MKFLRGLLILLCLPLTIPFLLLGMVIVFIGGGLCVVKQTFWPDSLG